MPPASARPFPVSDPGETWSRRVLGLGQGLLALGLLTLPLVFSTQTQDQFELPKQLLLRALSSLALGALLALSLADGRFRRRRAPLDLPVLAWSLWLLACTLHSVSPAVSWRGEYENFAGCLTQWNYAALYFLAVQFLDRPQPGRLAARAVLAAAFGTALYALMQALQRDWVGWSSASVVSDRFFGTLGNPNFLGGFMAMAISLKLALGADALESEKPVDPETPWRWLALGGLVLAYVLAGRTDLLNPFLPHAGASSSSAVVLGLWLAAAGSAPLLRRAGRVRGAFCLAQGADLLLFFQVLANTATRGAFLGLMAGLGVLALGWLALRPAHAAPKSFPDAAPGPLPLSSGPASRPAGRLAFRTTAGLGLLALILLGAFAGLGPAFRARTLASLRNPYRALEVSRLEIWGPALKIWEAHPLAGTGLDTFKTVFPRYSHARFADYDGENVASRMAHCEPLQILATQGAIGLALWLWLCVAAFLAWWRVLRAGGDPAARGLLLGLGPLMAAYLAQNLVSFGVAGISAPYWTCLGLLFCASELPRSASPRLPALGWGPALALGAMLAAGGLWLDSQTLRADVHYAFGSELQNELGSLEQADLGDLRDAVGFAQGGLEQGVPLTPDLDAEAARWRQSLSQSEARLNEPGAAQALLPYYRRAAGALMMVLAAAHMEEAARLCPQEVKYQIYLGLCYEELFRRCDPDRRAVWFQAADAAYTRGVDLNPGNAYYWGDLGRLWSLGAQGGDRDFYAQAQQYYLRAVDRAPVTRLFYENLMGLQARFADLKGADALMDKVQAADKELAPVLLMEMAGAFAQWRESDAPDWKAQSKAAALQTELGWIRRAQALAPGDADYALSLAVFELQAGDKTDAAAWARKALELNPKLDAAGKFLKENRLP